MKIEDFFCRYIRSLQMLLYLTACLFILGTLQGGHFRYVKKFSHARKTRISRIFYPNVRILFVTVRFKRHPKKSLSSRMYPKKVP